MVKVYVAFYFQGAKLLLFYEKGHNKLYKLITFWV